MEIISGVTMLKASPHSHVFLIRAHENILIDAGLPGAYKKILPELDSMGIDPKSIRKILITHHDIDHIGSVKKLAELTGAQVWAPGEDIPYIKGEKSRPGIKRVINAVARAGIPGTIQPFEPNQQFGELKVIPAPGHTPGHVIFYYNKIIFAGDLLRIKNGLPQLMPKHMNADNSRALLSIGLLKNLDFEWLCPSHGEPVKANEALRSFIAQY